MVGYALIDSYDGNIQLLKTGNDFFTEMFTSQYSEQFKPIPNWLEKQIRYPVELFNWKTEMYNIYHVTDVETFIQANEFYEICLRLLKFYNAVANYENDKKGLFAYFSHRNALSYLADNPQILKDMELIKATNLYGNKAKGTNSGVKINAWGRRLQADWMLESAYNEEKTGLLNLHKIRSIGYLKEAIAWNEDGNFDRVSSMGMVLWHDATMRRETEQRTKEVKTFLDSDYFQGMGVIRKKENKAAFNPFQNN